MKEAPKLLAEATHSLEETHEDEVARDRGNRTARSTRTGQIDGANGKDEKDMERARERKKERETSPRTDAVGRVHYVSALPSLELLARLDMQASVSSSGQLGSLRRTTDPRPEKYIHAVKTGAITCKQYRSPSSSIPALQCLCWA